MDLIPSSLISIPTAVQSLSIFHLPERFNVLSELLLQRACEIEMIPSFPICSFAIFNELDSIQTYQLDTILSMCHC